VTVNLETKEPRGGEGRGSLKEGPRRWKGEGVIEGWSRKKESLKRGGRFLFRYRVLESRPQHQHSPRSLKGRARRIPSLAEMLLERVQAREQPKEKN